MPESRVGSGSEHSNEARAKRTARASMGPLGALVIAAFLPMINTCSKVESVVELSADAPLEMGSWVAPPFLVAALLLVLTVVALSRGVPSPAFVRVGTVGVGLCAASALGAAAIWIFEVEIFEPQELAYVAWPALAGLLGVAILWRSRREKSWLRWGSIGLAHAVITTHFFTWLIPAGIEHLDSTSPQVGSGALVYAIATIALVVMWRLERRGRNDAP